jgi:hypothetical protein
MLEVETHKLSRSFGKAGQGIWAALLISLLCCGVYFFTAMWSGKRFEQRREKIAHSIS